jgi:farnesyl-diphosphate farnesyltransferase
MTRSELGGPILAAVSRSFYLTIRLLPERLRAPIGLAYLLARTSDTIADSSAAPAGARLAHLAAFEEMCVSGGRAGADAIQSELLEGCTPGERALLAQLAPCLDWLEALDPFDREEIRAVLRKIIHGQRLDLQRFAAASPEHVIALAKREDLEEYTYLVAGCVGEFWTRVCQHWIPRYSSLPSDELLRTGIDFGKGLQLVNILRDLPADLHSGRCYLPLEDLTPAGLDPATLREQPARLRPVSAAWLARARELLRAGDRYVRAIRPARVRIGCYLPWRLGVQTLDLIERRPPLETPGRVKVGRPAVYRALAEALWRGFLPRSA